MYKVFFKDHVIYLTDDITALSDMEIHHAGAHGSSGDLKILLDQYFNSGNRKDLCLYHHHLDELYDSFKSCFIFIHAAGGLVRNGKGESLFIFRRGKWDLPKGKPEKGEIPEQTAIREVQEECNIHGLTITRFITSSYHIYSLNKGMVLKRTDWFEMSYNGDQDPTPCEKEQITDLKWLQDDQVGYIAGNTFPAIMDVVGAFLKIK